MTQSLQNDTENSYCKVFTICDRSLLQGPSGITKCERLLLRNSSAITKCDSYCKVRRNTFSVKIFWINFHLKRIWFQKFMSFKILRPEHVYQVFCSSLQKIISNFTLLIKKFKNLEKKDSARFWIFIWTKCSSWKYILK